jgi:hypothetical protein
MNKKKIDKYLKISRLIVTLLAFIILNAWFLWENDPQWILSIIISCAVFIVSFPSSKICLTLINKGDNIKNTFYKVAYYGLALPIIFFVTIILVAILCSVLVSLIPEETLTLGLALLIAFAGIGIFTCILVPYFQTLIILLLKKINF